MPETKPPGIIQQLRARAARSTEPTADGGVQKRGILFLLFGVLLPLTAMLFECTFHFCAQHFFDPFPSASHVVLFALIPLSNFLVWLGTRRDLSNHYAFMSLCSGMAMGVSCLYTLMLLPLTPISCFFTLALGLGLLGLAPLLSVPCNYIAGKSVCQMAARKGTYFNAHQFEHMGHMIILVMVIAIELPSTLTRINLSRAADEHPAMAQDGINWLRKFGSREVLLRACYERSGRATDILGSLYESGHPAGVDAARRIFYKVSGKPFNSVPIPKSARATIQHAGVIDNPADLNAGVADEFDIDTDIAGEAVSAVARGLSLTDSKLDGQIDATAATASLNWSMAFTNEGKIDREVRAKILLPPQAVVTKATLITGKTERDAIIMVRGKARSRYKQAVMARKDPLLVSTCGPDQVLVQCYPVSAGETVTIKLVMAAPMELDKNSNAFLNLPAFLERNFEAEAPNSVDVLSTMPLSTNMTAEKDQPFQLVNKVIPDKLVLMHHITGNLNAAQLAGCNAVVTADRDKTVKSAWSSLENCRSGSYVERALRQNLYPGIKHWIIVVDGSNAMQDFMPQIAEALKSVPPFTTVEMKVVGEAPRQYASAEEQLKNYQAKGGEDDSTVLNAALTKAMETTDTSVLWIHASQPVSVGNSETV